MDAKPPTAGGALVGGLATVVQQVAVVNAEPPPPAARSRVLRLRSSEEDGIPEGAHAAPPPRIPPEHETKRSALPPPSQQQVLARSEQRAVAPTAAAGGVADDQDPTAVAPPELGGGTGLTPTRAAVAAAATTTVMGARRALASVDTEDVPTAPAFGFAHLDGLVTVRALADTHAADATAADVTATDGRPHGRRPSQPAAVVLPDGEVAMLVPAADDAVTPRGGHHALAPSLVPTGHTIDGGPVGGSTATLHRPDGSEVTAADVAAARQVAAATLAEMAAAGQLQGFGDATAAPPAPRTWRDRLRVWWARNRRDVIAVAVTTGLIVVVAGASRARALEWWGEVGAARLLVAGSMYTSVCARQRANTRRPFLAHSPPPACLPSCLCAGLAIFAPFGALILVAGAGLALVAGEAAYTGYRGWARERRLRRLRQELLDAGTEPALAELAVRGPGVVADDPTAAGPYVPAAVAGGGDAATAAADDSAGGERDGGTGGVAPQRHPFSLFRRRSGWHRLGGGGGGRDYERLQQPPQQQR
jgi:hypothetical protein